MNHELKCEFYNSLNVSLSPSLYPLYHIPLVDEIIFV